MKNIKLMCLYLSLFVMTFASCTKPDIMETKTKEPEEILNSFVFEDGIREYVLNGKTVTDHQQIANAAKDAFNVHHDYPNERVVISTTPKVFESYQNSNTEFKQALEQSDKAAAVATDNNEDTRSARVAAIPAGAPPSLILAHQDKNMIGFSFDGQSFGETVHFQYHFIASSNSNLTKLGVVLFGVGITSGSEYYDGQTISAFDFNLNTKSTSVRTNFGCYMNNESQTGSLTKTFYTGANYTGTSVSFTAAANNNANLINLRAKTSGYLSYK